MDQERELRNKVLDAVREYYAGQFGQKKTFQPGDRIPYGGWVFDERELLNLTESL